MWLALFAIDKGLSRYSDCFFCICSFFLYPLSVERTINLVVGPLVQMDSFFWVYNQVIYHHTGQCKRIGGCYNELVVAFFSTGGGVKGKKIYTC